MDFTSPIFWTSFGSIIMADILLSGDNAIVIAMVAKGLPPSQQKKAIVFGSLGAVLLRVLLTVLAVELLALPYLKFVGGLLLIWVGFKLMQEEDDEETGQNAHNVGLLAAIRMIVIADLVMSMDNILAVAAAAHGSIVLILFGLALSIPFIVFGSTMLLKVIEKFPILVVFGAGLLGWLAGEMMFADSAVEQIFKVSHDRSLVPIGIVGALTVVGAGYLARSRK